MKKIVVILILISNWFVLNGQQDNPILLRIYEDGYSIEQIKQFAKEPTVYSQSYRAMLLSIINNGLQQSGDYIYLNNGQPLNESHIDWIYTQVHRVLKDSLPVGSSNTWKNGNKVSPCITKKSYYGPIDRFTYKTCLIKLDKPSCGNLLGYTEVVKKSCIVIKPQTQTANDNKFILQQSIIINNLTVPPPKEEKKIKIGWIVIPIFAIAVGTATYFLLKNQNHQDIYINTTYRPTKNPPIVVPSNPGGPGGTPIPGG